MQMVKVTGAKVKDQVTGEEYEIYAKEIVNATGPWVDTIREKDNSKKGKVLRLTKGVHIVIDQSKFPLNQAVYFDTPDGRMVFAIPRDGKAYVGTTDTFYEDDPIHPKMTVEDRDYLLEAIHYMFPEVNVKKEDVESNWAGVRPLIWEEGKDPSEISRKDEIWESAFGLITIAGGKLTGYRKMAEKIVDILADKFKSEEQILYSPCETRHLKISGGNVGGSNSFNQFIMEQTEKGKAVGLTEKEAEHLAAKYGSNVPVLFNIIKEGNGTAEKYNLPLTLYAKLQYALEHELAATPIDFFNRRISAILFEIETVKMYKDNVINYMKDYFEWDEATYELYKKELELALNDVAF